MSAASVRRLARLYREAIGYDPFEDDPTVSPAAVLRVLREWRAEAR